MHIIYLHQYFCKPDMNGGIRSYEFSKRLAEDGHRVIVVTTDQKNVFKGWRVEQVDGFEVHWLSVAYDNKMSYLRRILAFLKFVVYASIRVLQLKSDKLFATSTPLTIGIPALVYNFIKRKPYVFEVRDVWPEVPIALGVLSNPILIKAAKILEKWIYARSESIVALSPDMKTSILKVNSTKHIEVIPNASDTALFLNTQSEMKSESLCKIEDICSRHEKVLFYTGAFGIVNDLESLVELAKLSTDSIAFLLIGDGSEKVNLKEIAYNQGVLNQNLYILDPVKKSELVRVHELGDMAVSTVMPVKELYANSANKVFDAFASGTPLLINHGGWLKTLLDEHKCGLAIHNPPTPEDSDRLKNFLYNEDSYRLAEMESEKLGLSRFSRDYLYAKLKKVIENV